jgi:anaerobic ribonucleoside-triphosphate reductase activating protein
MEIRRYNAEMISDAPIAEFLEVARVVPVTEAEGPGRRFAVWLQGCPLRCPSCCNPEMLPIEGGEHRSVADLCAEIDSAPLLALEGITLLGGEPFAQPRGALALVRAAHERELTAMIFSGFTLEELHASTESAVLALLNETDVLVDGPYQREQPETQRRWIGSANQRVHFLTGRCAPDDPRWFQRNTLEVRLRGRELTVNGFPAPRASLLWKRPEVGHRQR